MLGVILPGVRYPWGRDAKVISDISNQKHLSTWPKFPVALNLKWDWYCRPAHRGCRHRLKNVASNVSKTKQTIKKKKESPNLSARPYRPIAALYRL